MSGKAAFTVQMGTAYFFNQSQYVRIKGLLPGTTSDSADYGPAPLNDWQSIQSSGFNKIDAILNMGRGMAYLFNDRQYIRVDNIQIGQNTDTLAVDARSIVDNWPSLKEAGFETIDGVLPMGRGVAYFFSGTQYVCVENIVPDESSDRLRGPPRSILDGWSSLASVGWRTIDAVLSIGDNSAYFFYRDDYIRVHRIVIDGGDEIDGEINSTADGWPSLDNFW